MRSSLQPSVSTDEPRLFLFLNNQLGLRVVRWLRAHHAGIAGLCVHPYARAKFRGEIVEAARVDPACVFEADRLDTPEAAEMIRSSGAALGISVMFGYIFRSGVLNAFPRGIVNLHTGLLP